MGQHAALTAEDRLRLACELHDDVIQRLFAIGMGLQSLVRLVDDPALAERLSRYMAELDETIADIRGLVLDLGEAAEHAV